MGQAEEMHIKTRVEKRIFKALFDLFSSEESSIEQVADVTEITAECFKREIFSTELSTLNNPKAGDMRTAVKMAKSRADMQYTADITDKIRLNLLFIFSLKRPRFCARPLLISLVVFRLVELFVHPIFDNLLFLYLLYLNICFLPQLLL